MIKITIHSSMIEKLKTNHGVSKKEVEECFDNVIGNYLYDTRAKHKSNPRTQWFIAETNAGRK